MVLHGNLKGVSEVYQGNFMVLAFCFKEATRCSKEVLRMFQGNLMGVLRVFQGLFKEVSRGFKASFKEVSRGCKGCFKGIYLNFSRVCQQNVRGVLKKFHAAWRLYSLQLTKQKEGLLLYERKST